MRMSSLWLAAASCVAAGCLYCLAQDAGPARKKILFYSQSFGFRHSVVARPLTGELAHAEKCLREMARKAGYEIHFTQDFNDLRGDDAFKAYDAVIFYTTGNPPINRQALMKWITDGGAFIGIHTATDTFHSDADYAKGWPEYVAMIGGAFRIHGGQDPVILKVEDPDHPATAGLADGWQIADEMYQFRDFDRSRVHMLLSVDVARMEDRHLQNQKMSRDQYYPVAWTRTEGKGRIFYTSLGHREDVWTNPKYQQHVLGGIAWAMDRP